MRRRVMLPAGVGMALVGTRAAVRAAVAGDRPVWRSQPHRGPSGIWVVHVRLVTRRERRRPRTVRRVWIAAGTAVVLAGTGTAVWLAATWLMAHWPLVAGMAVLLALVWSAAAARTGCPGLHCAGCRHR